MPVLPHHRRHWRIRWPQLEQCRRLVNARVDRGLAEKTSGTRSGYHRAASQFYGRRGQSLDGIPDDLAPEHQAAEDRELRGTPRCCPGSRPMKLRLWVSALLSITIVAVSGCRKNAEAPKADPVLSAYDTELDWTDAQKIIPLSYQQSQGRGIFYQQCVWCHADATPAGPSNRSNLTPVPRLLNDGATLNAESDEYIQNIITLGGTAMGKSAMMPPYGRMLSAEEIRSVIAFTRAIAQPPYQPSARAGSQYSAK